MLYLNVIKLIKGGTLRILSTEPITKETLEGYGWNTVVDQNTGTVYSFEGDNISSITSYKKS